MNATQGPSPAWPHTFKKNTLRLIGYSRNKQLQPSKAEGSALDILCHERKHLLSDNALFCFS